MQNWLRYQYIEDMERLTIEDSVVMQNVTNALKEDVGDGDITADLIDASTQLKALVITRERAVIAGQRWVNSVPTELMPNYFKTETYQGFRASRESLLLTISSAKQILSDANLRS